MNRRFRPTRRAHHHTVPSNISCHEVSRIRLKVLTGSIITVARRSTAAKGDNQATY
jgi:hypothetical protein